LRRMHYNSSKIICHLNKFQGRTPKPHSGGCRFAAGGGCHFSRQGEGNETGHIISVQSNQFVQHKLQSVQSKNYTNFALSALPKCTYGHLKSQNFPRGNSPGPPVWRGKTHYRAWAVEWGPGGSYLSNLEVGHAMQNAPYDFDHHKCSAVIAFSHQLCQ